MTLQMIARGQASLALLLSCAALGCATTPPPAPDALELRHLHIEGNDELSDKAIEERILTEGESWVPFSSPRYYDELVLETDLRRIVRLYEAEGYYQARILGHTVTPVGERRVDVTVRVAEGPPTQVRKLKFEGLPEVLAPLVVSACPLREGATFKEADYETCKKEVVQKLEELGYAEATLDGKAEVDVPSHAADVTLVASPGPRYRFGRIFVAGAEEVPRERITYEARQAMPEGELYSLSKVSEAQRRVFDLGVFSTVRVLRGAPDREAGVMPMVVAVSEAPFRTLRLAAGFGLDPRFTELPRVSTEWTHRNFEGGLRKLSLLGEASLVYLPNLWVIFRKEAPKLDVALNVGAQLEQPEIIGHNTSLTLALGVQREVDVGYQTVGASAGVGLVYRWRRKFEFTPSYQFQIFKLTGDLASAVSTTTAPQAVLDKCSAEDKLCRLAYLEQRASFDLRDNPVEPTRGAYFSLSLQEGSRYLGGGYDYVRIWPEIRGYVPVGPVVVAARIQAGMLMTYSDSTSSVLTRFFLGGSTTERGFGTQQLSPSLVACRYRDPEKPSVCLDAEQAGKDPGTDVTEVLPIGGNAMVGGNLEVRIPLPASIGVVAFVDVGEVVPEPGDLRLDLVNIAVGLGLRYRTLFGPLRLDAAYRVNDPPLGFIRAPDLPQGAEPDPIWRFALHFSIGEAF